jgi:hypothetical protein
MPQEFTFTITISADGETVEGQVEGMKGRKCEDVQHVLDQIGAEVEHRHTAEYDESEPVRFGQSDDNKLQLGKW